MATTRAVQVGRAAPDFTCTAVVDGRLKEVSLSSYNEASHWVVLNFFPKAWSFICPAEIKAFSSRLDEFLYSRSCAVVFASTDSEQCLKAWNATSDLEGGLGGVHVPLISDCSHKLSRDYGVLVEEEGTAQRAFFIIDPKGIIRTITVNDVDVGRSVDEVLRILDALTFKEKFGEGCPVDWKKGDKGIDISDENRVEGTIELKKSWSEWARPKIQRAWSGASQRSVSSVPFPTLASTRLRADSNTIYSNRNSTGFHSALSSGQQSPLISPTSNGLLSPNVNGRSRMENQLDEALMQQRMENLQAALQNQTQSQPQTQGQGQTQSIGVAN